MNGQTLAEVFQNVENIVAVQIYPTDPAREYHNQLQPQRRSLEQKG